MAGTKNVCQLTVQIPLYALFNQRNCFLLSFSQNHCAGLVHLEVAKCKTLFFLRRSTSPEAIYAARAACLGSRSAPDIVGNPAGQRVVFGGSAGGLKEGIRPAEEEPRPHSGLRTKHTALQAGLRRLVLYPRRVPFLGEAIPGLPLVKLALGGPN